MQPLMATIRPGDDGSISNWAARLARWLFRRGKVGRRAPSRTSVSYLGPTGNWNSGLESRISSPAQTFPILGLTRHQTCDRIAKSDIGTPVGFSSFPKRSY